MIMGFSSTYLAHCKSVYIAYLDNIQKTALFEKYSDYDCIFIQKDKTFRYTSISEYYNDSIDIYIFNTEKGASSPFKNFKNYSLFNKNNYDKILYINDNPSIDNEFIDEYNYEFEGVFTFEFPLAYVYALTKK